MRGWFFHERKFDGEKYLSRAENKLSSLVISHCLCNSGIDSTRLGSEFIFSLSLGSTLD